MNIIHTISVILLVVVLFSQTVTPDVQMEPAQINWKLMDSRFVVEPPLKSMANLTVAKDASGHYKTIKEALAAAPTNSRTRFIIYVKKGVYDEIIRIAKNKTHVTIVGDGRDNTIITGNLSAKGGKYSTFESATLGVDGAGFMAQDICIQNTAGPAMGQAVALRVSADAVVIYRCRVDAYQDTLYAYTGRQFYRDTYITGTVDFICGAAAAVFQYCQIVARKPLPGQSNMLTAQSCNKQSDNSAFTIQKCNITASVDLAPIKRTVKTYLGRPWGNFSTVIIMESFIDDLINPAGWGPWGNETARQSTLYYGEYQNKGPGANTSERVPWKGFKVIRDPKELTNFTVGRLINKGSWLRFTGVPYEEGL